MIHGWVFMSNHVHLLLTPEDDGAISLLMQFLGRLYVRSFNDKYGRSGTLFEDRFKSSLVQDNLYLLQCLQYIELNPVRAGMVKDPGHYRWSSYHAHAFAKNIRMWTPHPLYLSLGDCPETRARQYRELVGCSLDTQVITNIRHCVNKGLILGSEAFRQQLGRLTGNPTE